MRRENLLTGKHKIEDLDLESRFYSETTTNTRNICVPVSEGMPQTKMESTGGALMQGWCYLVFG